MDPFCGTGTTLVEAKKQGIASIGCDAHPFAAMVSRVKTNWQLEPEELRKKLKMILRRSNTESARHGLEALSLDALLLQEETQVNGYRLTEDEEKLLPTGFLSQRLCSACWWFGMKLRKLPKTRIVQSGSSFWWHWPM